MKQYITSTAHATIMLNLTYNFQVVMIPNMCARMRASTHTHVCMHTHTYTHTNTIVVDCIRKSLLIAEEVMKKYTCLKYILYIYFTYIYIYILLFSCASLYLQICIIHTRVLEKASHSCNQQSIDETINFIWQEQGLITQNSLVKVRDKF